MESTFFVEFKLSGSECVARIENGKEKLNGKFQAMSTNVMV